MNNNIIKLAAPAFLFAAIVICTSCATPKGTMDITAVETTDGAIIVETFTTTATVKTIDAAKRKVTLVFSAGGPWRPSAIRSAISRCLSTPRQVAALD